MQAFTSVRGVIAPLDRANVDTDQIIPKQFLKSIARSGFERGLFFDWRYLPDGRPNPDFVLNAPVYQKAAILVVRQNFGCGSSREHAVWALAQYGFQALIAPKISRENIHIPGFADIFRNNCAKNGILAIELDAPQVDEIFARIERHPGVEATVDLPGQTITLHDDKARGFSFDIEPSLKKRLLQGLDDIAVTLSRQQAIAAFERRHDVWLPQQNGDRHKCQGFGQE